MDANTTKLEEIRQRAEAVGLSPEPWEAILGSWTVYSNYNTDDQAIVADVYERVDDGSANTIYIASARSDIPCLLDLIREQAAEIERLGAKLDWIKNVICDEQLSYQESNNMVMAKLKGGENV